MKCNPKIQNQYNNNNKDVIMLGNAKSDICQILPI